MTHFGCPSVHFQASSTERKSAVFVLSVCVRQSEHTPGVCPSGGGEQRRLSSSPSEGLHVRTVEKNGWMRVDNFSINGINIDPPSPPPTPVLLLVLSNLSA
uniref:Uncharacterized protein n=1 Tax=Knipowitschia caucasica TaxID=637954 RepID=A0AAV2ITV4_KNICA